MSVKYYKDGKWRIFPGTIGVPGKDVYMVAQENGYEGTREEYADHITRLPQVVDDLGNMISDWADGKRSIVKALKGWNLSVKEDDSFNTLSKFIETLPVKPENFEGVLPHTHNGIATFDLLQVLNNHQRTDYPYMYAILLDDSYEQVELKYADAYATCDEVFYEHDTTHTFVQHDDRVNHWVIFYYKSADYVIQIFEDHVLKIVAFNGRPRFNITNTSMYVGIIESYTPERYDIEDGGLQINNNEVAEIRLAGIRSIGKSCYITANACIDFSMPHLEYWGGGALTLGRIRGLKFPSLKELYNTAAWIQQNNAILNLNLPALEVMGGTVVLNQCSNIATILVPRLREIKAGTLVTRSNALTSLEVPALETMSGGSIVTECPQITSLEVPALETMSGGQLANQCTSLASIEAPVLHTISGGSIVGNCPLITSIILPSLELMWHGNNLTGIASSCVNLSYIGLPKARTIAGASGSGDAITQNPITHGGWLTIDLPSLRDSVYDRWLNTVITKGTAYTGIQGIIVNLGAPQGGNIRLEAAGSTQYIKVLTVQPGFRSSLAISTFTALSKEVVENILRNLADNSDYGTLTITLGATLMALVDPDLIVEVQNKNYTIN